MDRNDDAREMLSLQQRDEDERRARREHELRLAAEAHHRLRILNGDRVRLEDLAGEWIELLRASGANTTG